MQVIHNVLHVCCAHSGRGSSIALTNALGGVLCQEVTSGSSLLRKLHDHGRGADCGHYREVPAVRNEQKPRDFLKRILKGTPPAIGAVVMGRDLVERILAGGYPAH